MSSLNAQFTRVKQIFDRSFRAVGATAGIYQPRLPSTAEAKKKAVAFHRDPMGDGTVFTFASTSFTVSANGFSRDIGGTKYLPRQILYLTRIDTETQAATLAILNPIVGQRSFKMEWVDARFRAGVAGAVLGFDQAQDRDDVYDAILKLNEQKRIVWRVFKSRAKTTVKVAYGSLKKSVAKLLMDERSRWVKHNIQGWYVLQVVIWIDNCDADTAVKIRLCDPLTLLLPTFVSPVAPFMTWLGGEEIMHLHDPYITAQINEVESTSFKMAEGLEVAVIVSKSAGDHHALGPITGVPQGKSIHRDTMSRSLSTAFDTVFAQDLESFFELTWLKNEFFQLCRVSDVRLANNQDHVVITKERAQLRNYAHLRGKLVTRTPMFMGPERVSPQTTSISPPAMHNLVFLHSGNLQRLMTVVLPKHAKAGEFLSDIARNAKTSADGKISVCAASYRRLIVRALFALEPVLLDEVETRLRVFAPLLRLLVYMTSHIYSGLSLTPQRHARFSVATFNVWLLSGLLSNFANLSHSKREKKLLLDTSTPIANLPRSASKNAMSSLYSADCVHFIRWEWRYRLPWVCVLEDAFEATFRSHQLHTEATRSKTDLLGEEVKQTFKELARTMLPTQSVPSGLNNRLPPVRSANIIMCSCMLDRTVFRPVVSFNTNRFLEELGSKDQVRDFVWILPNNHIFFNVRSPSEDSDSESAGMLENVVICVANCAAKPELRFLSEEQALSQAKCSLRAFICLRKRIRRQHLRSLRRAEPRLSSDFAWHRVRFFEQKLLETPAPKRAAVQAEVNRWKARVNSAFEPPALAYRAPEYPMWRKKTVAELKALLVEAKEKLGGCRRKAELLQRLNEWSRRTNSRHGLNSAEQQPAAPVPSSSASPVSTLASSSSDASSSIVLTPDHSISSSRPTRSRL